MGVEQIKAGQLIINGKKFNAITYPIDDREIELYQVGAMAAAVEHSVQQLTKWEREGLFPKPLYKMTGGGYGNCSRWYSKEQIVNVRKVWTTFPLSRGRHKHKINFFKTVREVFYKTNIITLNVSVKDKNVKSEQSINLQRPS